MKRFVFFILIVSSYHLEVKCQCRGGGKTDCFHNDESNCCPCFPNATVQASFENIIFQFTDPPVSKQKMCQIAIKDIQIFQDYVNECNCKNFKDDAALSLDISRKSWTDFCSPNWPEEPECNQLGEAMKAVKNCFHRLTNVGYYIMKNIPRKDEYSVHCCSLPMQLDCAFNAAKQFCGKKYATLFTERLFGEFVRQQAKGIYCANLGNVCQTYGAELEDIKKILKDSEITDRRMGFTYYKIFLDSFQAQFYTYD